jgi:primosomal protein N' (replication factor Y) (superfamily II helicase)
VDRPILSLDRPFTYELSEELSAGVGSLVQVPFHGKLVRGWVLGPAAEVPARMVPVKRLASPVRFFDDAMLELLRWVSERYVAPLASVIARSHPPRVASEEGASGELGFAEPGWGGGWAAAVRGPAAPATASVLDAYRGGRELAAGLAGGSDAFLLRPAPGDEQRLAVDAVAATLTGGRSAIVLVPELDPVPATAAAVLERFGKQAVLFAGGSRRSRYRMWLDIRAGNFPVVVGTRPAVFAPVPHLGLVLVSRESHAGHREERSPYYHVRDVAAARSRVVGATFVAAALCPSAEAIEEGWTEVERAGRSWPPVEVVRPGPEGRAPRLVSALRSVTRAFLYEPLPGSGVARVCRRCGEPAACASCGGMLREEGGAVRCAVCDTAGRCKNCGASDFGIARRGAERVELWARRIAPVPVRRVRSADPPSPPAEREVLVGGTEAVKDFGPLTLDLVGILDADLAARRPGLASTERALATWMEAAAWAGRGGRVIVQTRRPSDPAVQALVTGNPHRYYRTELPRRADAGFPAGWPVFRVTGRPPVVEALRRLIPRTLLVSGDREGTVCLLALDPGKIQAFGRAARDLAQDGVIERVEAEPHL